MFAHIDAHRDAFVSRLMEYASHPSISAQGVGIAEVAEILKQKFVAMGFDTEIVPTKGNPIVMARWIRKPQAPTVLFYGHYDVQPPEPLEAWHTPYSVEVGMSWPVCSGSTP